MEHSIGIDVGKNEMVACIRRSDGVTEPAISFPNTTLGVRGFARKLEGRELGLDTPILMESTHVYHWKAARLLADQGWNIRIVNPFEAKKVLRASVRKRKTDKVDAAQLAFLAQQGYGYRFEETTEMAQGKALVRRYWKLRELERICGAHEAYLKNYRGLASTNPLAPVIARRAKALEKTIVDRFSKGNDLRYLDSIPGVPPLLAACLLAELTPLHRFQRVEQVIAFAGLDPSVSQSGMAPAHHGKISKRGSSTLLTIMYLAAFGSFAHEPFRPLYLAYRSRGIHHTAALCILGRKILRIAFTLLKKRQGFDPERFASDNVPEVP